jgi:hypothetical protein
VVWVSAQRPFRKHWARKIADTFDQDMFGVLVVTLPDGNGVYHVVEGQHRKSAVELLFGPDEKVPCDVINATNPARAAEIFEGINNGRHGVTPIETFKVRFTAGYLTEIDITKIVAAAGYRIERNHSERCIGCVDALRFVYTRCGPEILAESLKVIQATWGPDPNAVVSEIVRGYGHFLSKYPRANWGRMKKVMEKKFTPGKLIAAAKIHRETYGGSAAEAVTGLLRVQYNRGLQAKKQLN